jgi:hypothetical protein
LGKRPEGRRPCRSGRVARALEVRVTPP